MTTATNGIKNDAASAPLTVTKDSAAPQRRPFFKLRSAPLVHVETPAQRELAAVYREIAQHSEAAKQAIDAMGTLVVHAQQQVAHVLTTIQEPHQRALETQSEPALAQAFHELLKQHFLYRVIAAVDQKSDAILREIDSLTNEGDDAT